MAGVDRPQRRGARAVLAAGALAGLAYLVHSVTVAPHEFGLDYRVFHVAAETVLAGGDLYAAVPEGLSEKFHYVYPPITILGFLPFAALGDWVLAYALFTALTIAIGLAAAWLVVRDLEAHRSERRLPTLDRALIACFVVASVHAMPSLVFGQTNHALLLALVGGFLALDRDRPLLAGAAFGLAALYKPFLAGVGLWLLRRRAWRATAAAVVVGLGGLAASLVAVGPATMQDYLHVALLPRLSAEAGAGGGIEPTATLVTLRRPISALFPGLDPGLYGPLAALMLAPVLAALYLTIEDRTDRLVSILGTLVVVLAALPSYPVYLVYCYVALVPLLYLLEGRPYRLLVAGGLATTVAIQYDEVLHVVEAVDHAVVTEIGESALRPLFTVASPPLVGLALLLVACLSHRRSKHGPFVDQLRSV